MKKAIVMEKHRQYTIVLTKEGKFQKAKPIKNAVVGTEVSYELFEKEQHLLFFFHPSKVSKSFRLIAMACLLLIIIMPFYFVSNNNKTYAYVNVDINPSVELEIDEDLRVHSILPLNDDAKEIVNDLADYKGEPLDEVLSKIMDKSEEKGLIKNGKNVLVGVSYVDSETHKISVLDTIDDYFLDHKKEWKTATFQVPKEIRSNAKEMETSMNKLMAKSFVEKEMLDEADSSEQDRMNDEERAIIDSFYNNRSDKTNTVEPEVKASEASKEASRQKQHPSGRKEKNGQINGNQNSTDKKVEANKGKSNVAKEKIKKEKHSNRSHGKKEHKSKANHDDKEKNHDNRKHKVKHKKNNGHGRHGHNNKNKHD
ncbi:anti-sigma factor domain-containing protein [Virgibacillus ndiopensis]|uniref:anti-sigma factor domain-containing protein n=1 Tax=Virgibacillus ndiopensis TaxID=2004408 RepID=UPI000C0887DB|nr:anti-sigma factor domain-containing protein [Virgibacillus ndiopensis]